MLWKESRYFFFKKAGRQGPSEPGGFACIPELVRNNHNQLSVLWRALRSYHGRVHRTVSRLHQWIEMPDPAGEPPDAAGGSSFPYRPCKGRRCPQRVHWNCQPAPDRQGDRVQKGYSWLLKETSRKHTNEVFAYVMKNKRLMPRMAMRCAIGLMPGDLKAGAMKKNRGFPFSYTRKLYALHSCPFLRKVSQSTPYIYELLCNVLHGNEHHRPVHNCGTRRQPYCCCRGPRDWSSTARIPHGKKTPVG